MIDHGALVSASQQIGDICEMAAWASESLAKILSVEHPGKTVADLTVGEILASMDRQAERWKRILDA